MSAPPLTSRVLLACCGIIHPLGHQPLAASRQIHALCDSESIGINRQVVAAEPARNEMTFRVSLLTPSKPPFENVAAILQCAEQCICRFPIHVALDSLR